MIPRDTSYGLLSLVAGMLVLHEFIDNDSLSVYASVCVCVHSVFACAFICISIQLCAHPFRDGYLREWVPQGHLAHFTTSGPMLFPRVRLGS